MIYLLKSRATKRQVEEMLLELVAIHVQLALWQLNWSKIWPDPAARAIMADQAEEWSDQVLAMSGLLDQATS